MNPSQYQGPRYDMSSQEFELSLLKGVSPEAPPSTPANTQQETTAAVARQALQPQESLTPQEAKKFSIQTSLPDAIKSVATWVQNLFIKQFANTPALDFMQGHIQEGLKGLAHNVLHFEGGLPQKGLERLKVTTTAQDTPRLKPTGDQGTQTTKAKLVELTHNEHTAQEWQGEVTIARQTPPPVKNWLNQRVKAEHMISYERTTELFGSPASTSDSGYNVIFGDKSTGGMAGSAAQEELAMVASRSLQAAAARLQGKPNRLPLDEGDGVTAGKGTSIGMVLKNVIRDLDIDTQHELKIPQPYQEQLREELVKQETHNLAYQFHQKNKKNPSQEEMEALRQKAEAKVPNPVESLRLYANNLSTLSKVLGSEKLIELARDGNFSTSGKPLIELRHTPHVQDILYFTAGRAEPDSKITAEQVRDHMMSVESTLRALQASRTPADKANPNKQAVPMGYLGGGAFNNNRTMIVLSELAVAAYMGENIVFHDVGGDLGQFKIMENKFNEHIRPLILRGATKQEIADAIAKACEDEKNYPLSFD